MATLSQQTIQQPFLKSFGNTNLAAQSFQKVGNPYSSPSSVQNQQMPGSWFYEVGPLEDTGSGAASTGIPGDCSPIFDFTDDRRHTMESVEVPSSEHVAEIVGRQG